MLFEILRVNFEYIQHKIQHVNPFMYNVWLFLKIMHERVQVVSEAATEGVL